jgi:peptidoglycan/LPS O-acetylase OafA/YrhL
MACAKDQLSARFWQAGCDLVVSLYDECRAAILVLMIRMFTHIMAAFATPRAKLAAHTRAPRLSSVTLQPVASPAPPQQIPGLQPRKLLALTALRFVAAALLVLYHSQGSFGIPQDAWSPFFLGQGVSFFFVLSGFILTYVYPSLNEFGKRRFLLARFARIWPAHIAAFALTFLLLPPSARNLPEGHPWIVTLAQLLLVHAWVPIQTFYFSFNDVSWSISTECGLYLCFLVLIQQWRHTWKLKLALTALGVGVLAMLGNTYQAALGIPATNELIVGLMYIHPFARLFEFTLGMTMALAWQRVSDRLIVRPLAGTALELGIGVLVVLLMYGSRGWGENASSIPWLGDAGTMWLMRSGFVSIGFALLVLVMALEYGLVTRFLARPWLVWLGEISYSIYLVHKIVISYYIENALAFAPLPNWFIYAVFWVATILIAHIMYTLIELPSRVFLVRLWPQHPVHPLSHRDAARSRPLGFSLLRSWRGVLVSVVALALIAAPIAWVARHRLSIATVDRAYAEALAARGLREARQIRFGEHFLLVGADLQATDRGLRIELVWQSQATQRLQYSTRIELRNGPGKVVGRADYPQAELQDLVEQGTQWRDIITIPPEELQDATELALFLAPSTMLKVDQDVSQASPWLLLPLPSPVSK